MGYNAETDRQMRNFYSLSCIILRQLELKLFRLPCPDLVMARIHDTGRRTSSGEEVGRPRHPNTRTGSP